MPTPWTTAVADLRTLISDGAQDKAAYRKSCIGRLNGVNTIFKTFETRRVTNFTTATAPQGVYVDGQPVAVVADEPIFGEFTLASGPSDGQLLEATYYSQWYFDSELQTFLTNAMQWLGLGSDYTQITDGLQPAALHYAGHQAYDKAATRWSLRWSEVFQMNDSPSKENKGPVEQFLKISDSFYKRACDLRKNFYARQDQYEAPLFSSIRGRIREPTPPA